MTPGEDPQGELCPCSLTPPPPGGVVHRHGRSPGWLRPHEPMLMAACS